MARKTSIKYALKQALASKEAYGRSKYEDKLKTKIHRAKLQSQGVSYQERLRIDYSKNYVYSKSTMNSYQRWCGYFGNYLAENGLKHITIEESIAYIQEYIDYMKESNKYSAWTINLALASICKATGEYICDYSHPTRHISDICRGTKECINDNYNEKNYEKSLTANKLLGLRRSQLLKLKAGDIKTQNINGQNIVIVTTIGKGKKINHQIFYDKDEQITVLAMKNGKKDDERIFSKKEISHDADYHHMRELRAKEVYERVVEDISNNPERRSYYQKEINRIFYEAGRTVKENMDKPVYLRGLTREKAEKQGKAICYDRTALLFVSATVTSHWRSSVSLAHYIGK